MIKLPGTLRKLTPCADGAFALAMLKDGTLHLVERGAGDALSVSPVVDGKGDAIMADDLWISTDGRLAACLRSSELALYEVPAGVQPARWKLLGKRPGVAGSFCFAAGGTALWNLNSNRLKRFSTSDLAAEGDEPAGLQELHEQGDVRLMACLPGGAMVTWHHLANQEVVRFWPAGLGEDTPSPATIGEFQDYEWISVVREPVAGYLAAAAIDAPDALVYFMKIPNSGEDPEEALAVDFSETWGTSTPGVTVDPDASRYLVWNAERPSRLVMSIDPETRRDRTMILPEGHGPHALCGLKGGLLVYSPFVKPDTLFAVGRTKIAEPGAPGNEGTPT